MHYIIVTGSNAQELARNVNDRIATGYEAIGGVAVDGSYRSLFQAMIKGQITRTGEPLAHGREQGDHTERLIGTTIKEIAARDFDATVLKAPLPVIVEFFLADCTQCQRLAPVLIDLAEENAGVLKMVKVNADNEPAVTSTYNVRAVPTLLLFEHGSVVACVVGERSKRDLQKWITENLTGCR